MPAELGRRIVLMGPNRKQAGNTTETGPKHKFNRRCFLVAGTSSLILESLSCYPRLGSHREATAQPARFFFVSQGRTGLLNSDGTGLRYLDLKIPNQETWQPSGCFSDGRRVLMLSMEARRDGPGRPFSEYYTQTPTHLWIYDLDSGALDEIATRERMAVFYTPQLLLNDNRILVQVVRNNIGQIFSMNLNGTDAREFTRATDGFPYGLSLSPDGRRVAYHISAAGGTRFGPATLMVVTASVWQQSLVTSISVRHGRQTASCSLIKTAMRGVIQGMIGQMFA